MTAQIGDLVEKLGRTEASVQHRCGVGAMSPVIAAARAAKNRSLTEAKKDDKDPKSDETPLAKAVRDRSDKLSPPNATRSVALTFTFVFFTAAARRCRLKARTD